MQSSVSIGSLSAYSTNLPLKSELCYQACDGWVSIEYVQSLPSPMFFIIT